MIKKKSQQCRKLKVILTTLRDEKTKFQAKKNKDPNIEFKDSNSSFYSQTNITFHATHFI